ncbi:MAG: hypothetical protein ACYDDA_00300 [Acidiferrobacteraceae bacterium]
MPMVLPEAIAASYNLSGFAHLYDVAVGINLAYSLLEQVHNNAHKNYEERLTSLLKQCASLVEPGPTGEAINSHAKGLHEKRLSRFEKSSRLAVRITRGYALFATIMLVILLGVIGFRPEAVVSLLGGSSIIILFIAPVPLSAFILFAAWKWQLGNLTKELSEHKEQLMREKSRALTSLQAGGNPPMPDGSNK